MAFNPHYEYLFRDNKWRRTKPKAYCKSHKRYLLKSQIELHKCKQRHCTGYTEDVREVDQYINGNQFASKIEPTGIYRGQDILDAIAIALDKGNTPKIKTIDEVEELNI